MSGTKSTFGSSYMNLPPQPNHRSKNKHELQIVENPDTEVIFPQFPITTIGRLDSDRSDLVDRNNKVSIMVDGVAGDGFTTDEIQQTLYNQLQRNRNQKNSSRTSVSQRKARASISNRASW